MLGHTQLIHIVTSQRRKGHSPPGTEGVHFAKGIILQISLLIVQLAIISANVHWSRKRPGVSLGRCTAVPSCGGWDSNVIASFLFLLFYFRMDSIYLHPLWKCVCWWVVQFKKVIERPPFFHNIYKMPHSPFRQHGIYYLTLSRCIYLIILFASPSVGYLTLKLKPPCDLWPMATPHLWKGQTLDV